MYIRLWMIDDASMDAKLLSLTDGRMDRRIDGRTDRWTGRHTGLWECARISEHRSPLFVSALLRYSSLSITSGSWLCEGRRYKRGRSKKTGLILLRGEDHFFLILFYCCFSVTPFINTNPTKHLVLSVIRSPLVRHPS